MNLVEALNSIQSTRCCRCGWQASGFIYQNQEPRYLCLVHYRVEIADEAQPNWRMNPYGAKIIQYGTSDKDS